MPFGTSVIIEVCCVDSLDWRYAGIPALREVSNNFRKPFWEVSKRLQEIVHTIKICP